MYTKRLYSLINYFLTYFYNHNIVDFKEIRQLTIIIICILY